MTLNCIIVDDEPLAIKLLKSFVERTPFLNLVATFQDPMEALNAVDDSIHLLFLDIQMPGITGLELSKLIRPQTRIIFTTAYKEYAFESYQVQALDYLLKPVNYTTFLRAVTRGKDFFEQQESLTTAVAPAETADFMFVKCEYRQVRVDFSNILYISGLKDYVRIHLKDQPRPLIALSTMKAMEERLPRDQFCRIHRSYIIAMDKIESVERNRVCINGELLPITDAFQKDFFNRL